jgi:hypothetical protein
MYFDFQHHFQQMHFASWVVVIEQTRPILPLLTIFVFAKNVVTKMKNYIAQTGTVLNSFKKQAIYSKGMYQTRKVICHVFVCWSIIVLL